MAWVSWVQKKKTFKISFQLKPQMWWLSYNKRYPQQSYFSLLPFIIYFLVSFVNISYPFLEDRLYIFAFLDTQQSDFFIHLFKHIY